MKRNLSKYSNRSVNLLKLARAFTVTVSIPGGMLIYRNNSKIGTLQTIALIVLIIEKFDGTLH